MICSSVTSSRPSSAVTQPSRMTRTRSLTARISGSSEETTTMATPGRSGRPAMPMISPAHGEVDAVEHPLPGEARTTNASIPGRASASRHARRPRRGRPSAAPAARREPTGRLCGDPAVLHDRHPVGDPEDLVEPVRDVDERHASTMATHEPSHAHLRRNPGEHHAKGFSEERCLTRPIGPSWSVRRRSGIQAVQEVLCARGQPVHAKQLRSLHRLL